MKEKIKKRRKSNKEKILELLEMGMQQSSIAEMVGVSNALISQIKKRQNKLQQWEKQLPEIGSLKEMVKLYGQTNNISEKIRLSELIELKRSEKKEDEEIIKNSMSEDLQKMYTVMLKWYIKSQHQNIKPLIFRSKRNKKIKRRVNKSVLRKD